jgi:hypothetical protein
MGRVRKAPVANVNEALSASYLVPKTVTGRVRAMFQPVRKALDCSHDDDDGIDRKLGR